MRKLVCSCGYVFDLMSTPELRMWVVFKDADFEPLLFGESEAERLGAEYEQNQDRETELDQLTSEMKTPLYNCPACIRIIWYRGRDGESEVFVPEP